MLPGDISDYGGIRVNALPVQNPESEVDADDLNLVTEHVAQLTRPGLKAEVWFDTHTWAAAPFTYAAADVNQRSQWGTGDAQKPTVEQTAAGRYTLTWAASYNDALGTAESVSFVMAKVHCFSSDPLDTIYDCRPLTVTSNAITIVVKAGGVAADVGDNSGANFSVQVWVY